MYKVLIESKISHKVSTIDCADMDGLAYSVAIAEKTFPCIVIGVVINGKKHYCSSLAFSLAYLLSK